MKTWLAFWSGIFKNNPTFRLVLGLCPTLAVTIDAVEVATVEAHKLPKPPQADDDQVDYDDTEEGE